MIVSDARLIRNERLTKKLVKLVGETPSKYIDHTSAGDITKILWDYHRLLIVKNGEEKARAKAQAEKAEQGLKETMQFEAEQAGQAWIEEVE